MNVIQGYGISLLCFLFGAVSLPRHFELPIDGVRTQHIQPAMDEGDNAVLRSLWEPNQAPDNEPSPGQQSEALVGDSSQNDGKFEEFSVSSPESPADRIPPSVSLPKVKNDHPGRRKEVPADKTMRCPQFEETFKAYGLVPVQTWSYIAWRESRCRPSAQNATWDKNGNVTYMLNKNGTYDTGLLQINSGWKTVTSNVCGKDAVQNRMQGLKDIDCNLRVARYIMENSSGGLSNWGM